MPSGPVCTTSPFSKGTSYAALIQVLLLCFFTFTLPSSNVKFAFFSPASFCGFTSGDTPAILPISPLMKLAPEAMLFVWPEGTQNIGQPRSGPQWQRPKGSHSDS